MYAEENYYWFYFTLFTHIKPIFYSISMNNGLIWCESRYGEKEENSWKIYWFEIFSWFGKVINPLSANSTKWSNTLKQFVGNLPTNYLSVFDHFVKLPLKRLNLSHKQGFFSFTDVIKETENLRIEEKKTKILS